MKSDNQISKEYKARPIKDVAKELGIPENETYNFGPYITKVNGKLRGNKQGKLVLITSTSPNSRGVGKTTLAIGLNDALNQLGESSIVCVREPSLGPVFGTKGGACGGGYSQVYPVEDINLHFTGDFHAITTLNNTIAATIDNHLHQGNELNLDKDNILFKRCVDINDRTLRNILLAQGSTANGVERNEGFTITAASEIMATIGICTSLEDFTNRVEDIIIGYTKEGKEVYVKDLKIRGAIAVLMKTAINPNLVQTLSGNAAFLHAGPFANIAHGTNSLIATKMAVSMSDYTVVEAGFGTELGAEKFLNLVSKAAEFNVSHVVVVTTIPCLQEYSAKKDVKEGIKNLKQHIDHIKSYGIDFTVTLNKHETDTEEELEFVTKWLSDNNYNFAINEVFTKGAEGGIELAKKVMNANNDKIPTPLYELADSIEDKIFNVVTKAYGATGYNLTEEAKEQLQQIKTTQYKDYPICISKTPMSLSDDPKNRFTKEPFAINITGLKVYAGAKFIVIYCGNVLTMPGLGKVPNIMNIKYDFETEEIEGLS
ncbi:MAG: formate--tetrahydrofolate ligase [Mycoplasmatales bacterium]